jgi:hypothetical protein
MCVLYHRGRSLSSLFDEKFGEIATVHGEGHSLNEAGEGNRGRVVTYHGEHHAPIVLAGLEDYKRGEGIL